MLFFSPVLKIQVYKTEQDHSTTGTINDICDPFIIIFLDEITWKQSLNNDETHYHSATLLIRIK